MYLSFINSCRATMEPEFNHTEKNPVNGLYNIPLELKILCALRVLATGCKFKEAAEMSQYMHENTAAHFFKVFCQLMVDHFKTEYIKPLEGEDLLKELRHTVET